MVDDLAYPNAIAAYLALPAGTTSSVFVVGSLEATLATRRVEK